MRIKDLMAGKRPFLSLEFFPPKEDDKLPAFFETAKKLQHTNPLFTSVTYGAGGSTQGKTLEIVRHLKKDFGFEPMAHLTCVGASEETIHNFLQALRIAKIDNVLALRGDPPQGTDKFVPDSDKFQHATDLIAFIKKYYPDLDVGVAAYPEKHPEAESQDVDNKYLKIKLDLNSSFAITQLFFENSTYYRFIEQIRTIGITKPVVPGILPILSLASIKRIISMCGSNLPKGFFETLEKAHDKDPKSVRALGIKHAQQQIIDLIKSGAPGVHLYTLNNADACLEILDNAEIQELLG